mmetsp:Transcript_29627/g.70629  ORF Transcript_29627/g.70629 Transcript_29627/m.70629 type:complete len:465 (+) Transcript_29627:535-1929(+)
MGRRTLGRKKGSSVLIGLDRFLKALPALGALLFFSLAALLVWQNARHAVGKLPDAPQRGDADPLGGHRARAPNDLEAELDALGQRIQDARRRREADSGPVRLPGNLTGAEPSDDREAPSGFGRLRPGLQPKGQAKAARNSSSLDLEFSDVPSLRAAWERLTNFSAEAVDRCGGECRACARSMAVAGAKLDAELLRSGDAAVISGLHSAAEKDRKAEALAREIVRCVARILARSSRKSEEAKSGALERAYDREMREIATREKQAAKYEMMRQKLMDSMEREERERGDLHAIAKPLWYSIETLRAKAEEVCRGNVDSVMLSRQRRGEAEGSAAAADEEKRLMQSCTRQFIASREKVRQSAEELQEVLERRKHEDFANAQVNQKQLKLVLKAAGIGLDAMDEISSIKEQAMHTTYSDLERATSRSNTIWINRDKGRLKTFEDAGVRRKTIRVQATVPSNKGQGNTSR